MFVFILIPGNVSLLHPPSPPGHGHVLIVGCVVGIGHIDVDQVVVIVVIIIVVVVVIIVDVVSGVDDGVHHSEDKAEKAKGRHSSPSSNQKPVNNSKYSDSEITFRGWKINSTNYTCRHVLSLTSG